MAYHIELTVYSGPWISIPKITKGRYAPLWKYLDWGYWRISYTIEKREGKWRW